MADSGYNWSDSWTFLTKSGGGDWSALAVADDGNAGSTAISMDGYAAVDIAFDLYEDNTGAINGNVTIAVLADADGTNYEDVPGLAGAQVGGPMKFQVLPVQNDHVYGHFRLLGSDWSSFKIWILNEGGQELATSFRYKYATIPVAS
jgi:hypothetical protein